MAHSEGVSCLRRSLSEDGCFGPLPCSIWFGPFTCSLSIGPCVHLPAVQRCTLYRVSWLLPQRPSSSRLPGRSSPEASAFLGQGDQQLELCCHLVVSTWGVPRVRTASGSQRTPGHVGLGVHLADLSPSSTLVLGRRERLQFVSWKCQFFSCVHAGLSISARALSVSTCKMGTVPTLQGCCEVPGLSRGSSRHTPNLGHNMGFVSLTGPNGSKET